LKGITTIVICFLCVQVYAQDSIFLKSNLNNTLPVKLLEEVIVSPSKIKEKLFLSPVSVEKLNGNYFTTNASPSFFEALQNVKGIQMITPSLGFKVINTRGFANTTNVRFAQLADGMDIQSPHIGAPVGNALGPTDLDIKTVEIIPGSSSALYGMNAINGMVNFFTKDPFTNEGLSLLQKTGINHVNDADANAKLFSETSIRFAKKLSPKFAYKINAAFSKGTDWMANNQNDLSANANSSTGLTGIKNPAYDGVNSYGNESANRRTLLLQGKSYVVARTGYNEKDVVNYSLQNVKADIGFYYKPTDKISFKYTYHIADFNTVYQRANRFQLRDYVLQQHGLEFSSGSITGRTYINMENTGKSYNIRSMAENIDRSFKSDNNWFADFSNTFNEAVNRGSATDAALRAARAFADEGRPQPGSATFNNTLNKLQNINNWDSGAALKVKAKLIHAEMQWDITNKILASLKKKAGIEILAGFDSRMYIIVPDGNYFINPLPDKTSENLNYKRYGGFVTLNKKLFNEKLKLGVAVRLDKNDYFDANTNLRISSVYSISKTQSIRMSFQDGSRYPSIFEAFSNVNSGGVKRVGGLKIMSNGIFENGRLKSSIDNFQAAVNKDINTAGLSKNDAIEKNKTLLQRNDYTYLKPEHLRSFEMGYRGFFFNKKLYADADFYFSNYQSFIAQVEMSVPNTTKSDSIPYALYDKASQKRYRMWTNSKTNVHSYGFGINLKYDLQKGLNVSGNISYANFTNNSAADGLEDGFNTPKWIANISVAKENVFKNAGASISWRWQDAFFYQSFLVNGNVAAQSVLDAQLNYSFTKQMIKIKIGATNLLNKYYTSILGGPQIGGFYYTTITYGLK
jgi:outer membrane receptor protein involved in Fe transport